LKDKEDELLEELLDDTNGYSAEENEDYFYQEADTDNDGSENGSVFDGEDDMSYQVQDKYVNDVPVNHHENIAPSVEARNFDREETIQYFEREVLMGTGTGGRGLVAESFFRSLGKTLHEIEEKDTEICIQMAILVNALSSRQNTLLSGFLNLFLTKMDKVTTTRNQVWENKEIGWACVNCSCATCLERRARNQQEINTRLPTCLPPIPRTINRMRSVIMNGQYSFINMLPRPMIRMQGNHSYVLPSECIKFFLGSGHLPLLFDIMAVPLVYTSPQRYSKRS
jgi:hypothetical protein